MKILNIVSCDAVIGMMLKAKIKGKFLPWCDFLHVGPVPQQFSLQQLSKIRTYFMKKENLDKGQEFIHFEERNEKLNTANSYEKIILWFEHDLHDQLQLLQVLAWIEENISSSVLVTFIHTDLYLGECSIREVNDLLLTQENINPKHLNIAKKAWSAFREPTPLSWFKLLKEDTSALPFLKNTILRMLEEYPNSTNGLSRSAHQALLIISNGHIKPQHIFSRYQKYEERKFMGDMIFWNILDEFVKFKLIDSKEDGQILTITNLGTRVLNGKENWININPKKHWIGGVNIHKDNFWCWDIKKKTIAKYYYSKALSSLLVVK